jgi:hypothetical protein
MQKEKQLKLSDKLKNMKSNSKWRCDVKMKIFLDQYFVTQNFNIYNLTTSS